jgi:hypothetical protein
VINALLNVFVSACTTCIGVVSCIQPLDSTVLAMQAYVCMHETIWQGLCRKSSKASMVVGNVMVNVASPAIWLGGSSTIRLRSTTPIGNLTLMHFYLYRWPHIETSASPPQWYETLHQTSWVIFLVIFNSELISRFTFNWLIYYSSIISSRELYISCYTALVF